MPPSLCTPSDDHDNVISIETRSEAWYGASNARTDVVNAFRLPFCLPDQVLHSCESDIRPSSPAVLSASPFAPMREYDVHPTAEKAGGNVIKSQATDRRTTAICLSFLLLSSFHAPSLTRLSSFPRFSTSQSSQYHRRVHSFTSGGCQ